MYNIELGKSGLKVPPVAGQSRDSFMIDSIPHFANRHSGSYQGNVILHEFISQHNKLTNPHRVCGVFVRTENKKINSMQL